MLGNLSGVLWVGGGGAGLWPLVVNFHPCSIRDPVPGAGTGEMAWTRSLLSWTLQILNDCGKSRQHLRG